MLFFQGSAGTPGLDVSIFVKTYDKHTLVLAILKYAKQILR